MVQLWGQFFPCRVARLCSLQVALLVRLSLQCLERDPRLEIAQGFGQRGQLLQRRLRIPRVVTLAGATWLPGIVLKACKKTGAVLSRLSDTAASTTLS